MCRNSRLLTLVSTIGLIVGVSAYYYYQLGTEITEVQTGRVLLVDELVAKVTANGEIKPKEYVELQAEISGVITQLLVADGDLVEKGDILQERNILQECSILPNPGVQAPETPKLQNSKLQTPKF